MNIRKSNNQILVSVVSITYNHEPYIRQCLDGFVMQKTNFNFEVLIHDDASTDKTASIIREYETKYPNIIKPIYQTENQWSKGIPIGKTYLYPRAKGKYLAECEGDDYWTDPSKLQRQVDFLESHPTYALCFHPVKVHFENNEEKDSIFPTNADKSKFTVKELLKGNFIQINSVMYRKQKYTNIPNVLPADWYLNLYHAQFGKIGFINRTMSVYRRHSGSVWWANYEKNHLDFMAKRWETTIKTHNAILELYGTNAEYKKILDSAISSVFQILLEIDKKRKSKLVNAAVKQFPDNAVEYIKQLRKTTENREKDIQKVNLLLARKDQEIEGMKSSKSWKITKPLRSIHGKFAQ